jgi:quercetin dioxygenase-like cupin family protein
VKLRKETRVSTTVYGPASLAAEIERFQPGDAAAGRRAETLVKTDDLRVVLVTMRRGAALQEHTAPGTITIQTLRGDMTVDVEGTPHEVVTGHVIALAAGARHTVHARSDGAFLLTIAWPGGARQP